MRGGNVRIDRKSEATLRYPPKYRPDLNSIEMPNSTFKEFPHSAERTIPGLYGQLRAGNR
jgi:hypothetical protein